MKKIKQEFLLAAGLLMVSGSVNAFNDGDIISFDPGVNECAYPGLCDWFPAYVTKGSYFALDTDGNGIFEPNERVAISPGPDGGIVVGALQPGPGIDEPWMFFGVLGMHQTTTIPVTQNADGSLDFSGWEVYWNGMVVPLGSGGSATVNCSAPLPCTVADSYQIDYTATVVTGPFLGVNYQLHLENVEKLPSLNVSLSIAGGDAQECSSTGGSDINAVASVELLNGAVVDTIEWTLDGQPAGTGTSFSSFLALGAHNLSVTATAVTGQQDTASTTVTVYDSTAPSIISAFYDNRTGEEITSIETRSSSYVGVKLSSTDVCDPAPVVSAVGGFSLVDGDTLKIQGNLDKVELTTSVLTMSAKATDSSGNSAVADNTLTITP